MKFLVHAMRRDKNGEQGFNWHGGGKKSKNNQGKYYFNSVAANYKRP